MLGEAGLDQGFVREHSPEWIAWAHERLDRRWRLRAAKVAELQALAASVPHSEQNLSTFKEAIQELRGMDDEEIAYLMDPNAQFDAGTAAKSGMYQPSQAPEMVPVGGKRPDLPTDYTPPFEPVPNA